MAIEFLKCFSFLCESKENIVINENDKIKNDIFSKLNFKDNDLNFHLKGMEAAKQQAKKSFSNKRKVGCVIIDNNEIISSGYNKVPECIPDKSCEINNVTHWYVIHAEEDAILNLINKNIMFNNPIMYITLSPCKNCSKLILQSGIKNIIYEEKYKENDSINLLKSANIDIKNINEFI